MQPIDELEKALLLPAVLALTVDDAFEVVCVSCRSFARQTDTYWCRPCHPFTRLRVLRSTEKMGAEFLDLCEDLNIDLVDRLDLASLHNESEETETDLVDIPGYLKRFGKKPRRG